MDGSSDAEAAGGGRVIPNFFSVGFGSSGSTTLHRIFMKIPEIYVPAEQDIGYFSKNPLASVHDEKSYLDLFRGGKGYKIVCECSAYAPSTTALEGIRRASPGAKILISVRDPVERVYSVFLRYRRHVKLTWTFEELMREHRRGEKVSDIFPALDPGMHSRHVRDWMGAFGRDNVKVILFEEFVRDQEATVRGICEWLGIEHDFAGFRPEAHNPSIVPRVRRLAWMARSHSVPAPVRRAAARVVMKRHRPPMSPEVRSFLREFFRDDFKEMEALLGRQLPWKNFS